MHRLGKFTTDIDRQEKRPLIPFDELEKWKLCVVMTTNALDGFVGQNLLFETFPGKNFFDIQQAWKEAKKTDDAYWWKVGRQRRIRLEHYLQSDEGKKKAKDILEPEYQKWMDNQIEFEEREDARKIRDIAKWESDHGIPEDGIMKRWAIPERSPLPKRRLEISRPKGIPGFSVIDYPTETKTNRSDFVIVHTVYGPNGSFFIETRDNIIIYMPTFKQYSYNTKFDYSDPTRLRIRCKDLVDEVGLVTMQYVPKQGYVDVFSRPNMSINASGWTRYSFKKVSREDFPVSKMVKILINPKDFLE